MASSALGVLVPLPCACPLQLVHPPPCMHPLLLPPFPPVHRNGGTCPPHFPPPLPLVCATPLFTHVPSFFSVFPIFHMEAHGNWGCRSWVSHAHEWERCTHCPC